MNRYGLAVLGDIRGPMFRDWIGQGRRVLDIGCRDGALTRWYVPHNEVTGVDVDRHALELAAPMLYHTLWLDVETEWRFLPQSFDVIVLAEILEHLKNDSLLMAHVAMTLRPGGLCIGSVPNDAGWRGNPPDVDHKRQYTADTLRQLLEAHLGNVYIAPIGVLKGRQLPVWFMEIVPSLTQGWVFRCSNTAIIREQNRE